MESHDWLQMAVQLAMENVDRGGGPFAAVVVRNGALVAVGRNEVTPTHDPTAHAEIQAIRSACRTLGDFQLTECDLYSSCEPCPMCLGAIYWARLRAVYFAASRHAAAEAGFDDAFIYEQVGAAVGDRSIPMKQLRLSDADAPFDRWRLFADKTPY
ncbi:MAG: nucleoside deaminase [Alicyclobacillus sp.]|nr:nucleoside deaminase [Alicyclobacillus sp.]